MMDRTFVKLTLGAIVCVGCAAPRAGGRVGSEPQLRVAVVVAASEARIGGAAGLTARGSASFSVPAGEDVRVVPDGGRLWVPGRGETRFEHLRFSTVDRSKPVAVNGRTYHGTVDLYARDGAIYVVNEIGMESYLLGVVNAELGDRTRAEAAALQAQAVVSRTYALVNLGRYRSDGYDIRGTPSDQLYLGVQRETAEGVDAVHRTAGMVITFDGEVAAGFFHSTCGYSTASPSEVFRTVAPRPYLVPVSDRRPGGGYYGDMAPRFRWTVEWDGPALRDILRRSLPTVLGIDASAVDVVHDVRVHRRGPSGRATEIRIEVGTGEIPVFGPDIRNVLLRPDGTPLLSTALELSSLRTGSALDRLVAHGWGWGHGVGMCQWGAIGRARAGHDMNSILGAYFPGTRVERWY